MTNPKAATGSPLAMQPPGRTAAGGILCPLFYEKDPATGLPTGLVYDEAGNNIPAPNFPTGSGVVVVSSGVPALGVAGVDYSGPGADRTITASANATLADINGVITGSHGSTPIVVTIPPATDVAWPVNATIELYQAGVAACSFAAGVGVTLKDVEGLNTSHVRYSSIRARRISADLWEVVDGAGAFATAAQGAKADTAVQLGTARTLTASGNAVLADALATLTCNHATVAVVVTIPPQTDVAWGAEAILTIYMAGAAAASFTAGAGVTLHDAASKAAALAQYGVLVARRVASDVWAIV